MMKRLIPALLMLSLFTVASVAPATAADTPKALEKRVTDYMTALIAKNWDMMYGFHDMEFRKAVSKESFLARARNVDVKEFRIADTAVAKDGQSAEVKMMWVIQFQGYTFKDAPKNQQWVLENGDWFLKEKNEISTPFGPAPVPTAKKP